MKKKEQKERILRHFPIELIPCNQCSKLVEPKDLGEHKRRRHPFVKGKQ